MAKSVVGVDFDYEYNGILSRDVLFKPTIDTPALSDIMTIRQFARYKERLPTLIGLEKQIKKYNGGCDRTFTDGIDIQNTTLTLEQLDLNMEWCKDDFESNFTGNNLSEEMLRNGINEFDPSGTEIQTIINQLVNDTMRRDTFRIFSFGDKASLSTDFDQIDGLWTQLIGNSGSGDSYCVRRVGPALGTDDLAEGAALSVLKEAYKNSATILKRKNNREKRFYVTGSIYENLMDSYESNTTGGEKQFLNLVEGQGEQGSALRYRGIDVFPVYAWDDSLKDIDNPLNGTTSHLLLYTIRENHIAGFKNIEDSERISGWYERKDRKYYIEGFYRMGYTYIHCDLQTIAF